MIFKLVVNVHIVDMQFKVSLLQVMVPRCSARADWAQDINDDISMAQNCLTTEIKKRGSSDTKHGIVIQERTLPLVALRLWNSSPERPAQLSCL